MRRVVLYHANCPDGFTAAWCAWLRFGDSAEYLPVRYQEDPPWVAYEADVLYVLDFSYPREVMESFETRRPLPGRSEQIHVYLYDHHKSALENLSGWQPRCGEVVFDMERSGARLAWDYIVRKAPERTWSGCSLEERLAMVHWPDRLEGGVEWLVDYVQDRDLWRWKLPRSREVSAALRAVQPTFEAWSDFAELGPNVAADRGEQILAYDARCVAVAVANAYEGVLAGYRVPILNSTHLFSEVLEALLPGRPFAASWRQGKDGRFTYSLRSAPDGLDVSEIARRFGGGGHARAAGFSVDALVHERRYAP